MLIHGLQEPSTLLSMFYIPTSCRALHRGATGSMLTESLNIQSILDEEQFASTENERTSGLVKFMRWPHFNNGFKMIYDNMIGGQTPLTM